MKKFLGFLCVVFLIGGGVLWAVIQGGFLMKPSDKILLALASTVTEESELLKVCKGLTILGEEEFTIDRTVRNGENYKITKFSATPEEKQFHEKVHYLINLLLAEKEIDMEYTVAVDDQYVKVLVPTVTDKILLYDYLEYAEESDSVTPQSTETINESGLDFLNELSEELYGYLEKTPLESTLDEIKVGALELWNTLEFEKTEKEYTLIDNELVECSVYSTIVTNVDLLMFIQLAETAMEENYGLDGAQIFGKLKEQFASMSDIKLSFIIYKNKIAVIRAQDVSGDVESYEIVFKGGARRMQNIDIREGNMPIWQVEGSTNGTIETAQIMDYSKNTKKIYTYDSANGQYTYEMDEERQVGTITNEEDSWKLSMEEQYINGVKTEKTEEIILSKGASLQIVEGDAISINELMNSEIFVAMQTFFDSIGRVVDNLFGSSKEAVL